MNANTTVNFLALIILPGVAAGLLYFVGVWPRLAYGAATLVSAITVLFLRMVPANMTVELLGRPLTLTPGAKQVLLITLIAVGLSNLVLAIYADSSYYPSVSLAVVSCIGFTVMMDNMTLAAVVLLIAAAAVTLIIAPSGHPRGQTQYLVAVSLGAVALASAASIMSETQPQTSQIGFFGYCLGFGLMLGLLPFGFWETNLGRDADALSSSLISLVLKPAVVYLLWRFPAYYPWLATSTVLPEMLRFTVLATVIYCSLRAAIASNRSTFVAVASQAQFALVLMTVLPAYGASSLLPITGQWLLARVPSILLLVTATEAWRRQDSLTSRGLFIIGVGAVIGIPGTPLFPVHLAALLSLEEHSRLTLPLLIMASGLAIGGARLLFRKPDFDNTVKGLHFNGTVVAALLLALFNLFLGLQPARFFTFLN